MPVTKSDLIEHLSSHAKLPKGTAEQIVNTVFDSMVGALMREERIEIRGFGSFEVRSYKAYKGRNPRTGEQVDVAAKKLPFFKAGKDLRERVNRGTAELPPAGALESSSEATASVVSLDTGAASASAAGESGEPGPAPPILSAPEGSDPDPSPSSMGG